jgi:hypothetical protein
MLEINRMRIEERRVPCCARLIHQKQMQFDKMCDQRVVIVVGGGVALTGGGFNNCLCRCS